MYTCIHDARSLLAILQDTQHQTCTFSRAIRSRILGVCFFLLVRPPNTKTHRLCAICKYTTYSNHTTIHFHTMCKVAARPNVRCGGRSTREREGERRRQTAQIKTLRMMHVTKCNLCVRRSGRATAAVFVCAYNGT